MVSPSVYIIVLNWNGLEDTLQCLRSLQKLTYENVKIHVVDNASDNNEAEAIAVEFPNIGVLRQSENLGFCGGCNAGMKAALAEDADFIMLLNNDAIVSPTLIDDLLRGFGTLENAGAISPIITHYPEKEQIWAKWVGLYNTQMLSRGEYLGGLYDIGFDRPEAHAIRRSGKMFYAFYAPRFDGSIELRGLGNGQYRIVDYENDKVLGTVRGPSAVVHAQFEKHLLVRADPE